MSPCRRRLRVWRQKAKKRPTGSDTVKFKVAAGQSKTITFAIAK